MLKNLIKSKRFEMGNLLGELQNLCRLQNYLETHIPVYMERDLCCIETNNVIAYLTGDYIAIYDEFELEVALIKINDFESFVTKLSHEDILAIINNILDYDNDDLSDEKLLDEELEEEE